MVFLWKCFILFPCNVFFWEVVCLSPLEIGGLQMTSWGFAFRSDLLPSVMNPSLPPSLPLFLPYFPYFSVPLLPSLLLFLPPWVVKVEEWLKHILSSPYPHIDFNFLLFVCVLKMSFHMCICVCLIICAPYVVWCTYAPNIHQLFFWDGIALGSRFARCNSGCLWAWWVEQTVLELTEIPLPLPPKCRD